MHLATAEIEDLSITTAIEAGLKYVEAGSKGFTRVEGKTGFIYLDENGNRIIDEKTLVHIDSLKIPPAWQNVWICAYKNGHLQATGYDARGRKQYRYHPDWNKRRSEKKFDLLLHFGNQLPRLKRQIAKDLKARTFHKTKVCAIALDIMLETSIRVGNERYEKEYGSYGLTTLKSKHLKLNSSSAFFRFKGKKGVLHEIYIRKPQLVRILNKIQDLPGQRLLQYFDEDKNVQALHAEDLNEYLKRTVGEQITCKVVRTWTGCLHFIAQLALLDGSTSTQHCKQIIIEAIDCVAQKLGNTRTVCRNYYIHPELFNHYEQNKLCKLLKSISTANDPTTQIKHCEKALMRFLKSLAA
jgi:DNA topoisomerase-1